MKNISSWLAIATCLGLPGIMARSNANELLKIDVRAIQTDGQKVLVLDASETYSQAIDINAKGAVIGVRESANEEGTIFSTSYFYWDEQKTLAMPLPEGFTNVEPQAIADNGLVTGYATRPIGHPDGSVIAVVWDTTTNEVTSLRPAAGDGAAQAQAISTDGTRIAGITTGSNPPKLRPCVWSKNKDDSTWTCEVLPTLDEFNPYLMSSRVSISPDGKMVAACCTTRRLDFNQFDSDLFLWKQTENGEWERQLVTETQMYLRDMNSKGQIAGIITKDGKRLPVRIDIDGTVHEIPLLAGDASGEAWAVTESGDVLGFSDDPSGKQGGPQAFRWDGAKTTPLDFGDAPYSAVYAINGAGQCAGLMDTSGSSTAGESYEKTVAVRSEPIKK